jgi:hypothetical protein
VLPPALPPSHFNQLYHAFLLGVGVVAMLVAYALLRRERHKVKA